MSLPTWIVDHLADRNDRQALEALHETIDALHRYLRDDSIQVQAEVEAGSQVHQCTQCRIHLTADLIEELSMKIQIAIQHAEKNS